MTSSWEEEPHDDIDLRLICSLQDQITNCAALNWEARDINPSNYAAISAEERFIGY